MERTVTKRKTPRCETRGLLSSGAEGLAGAPAKYWSDRVPETTGRGAVLVHPHVEGIHDIHPGLPTFESGNVDQMLEIVRHLLAHPTDREELRQTLATYTRENNTYLNRLREVLRIVLGD